MQPTDEDIGSEAGAAVRRSPLARAPRARVLIGAASAILHDQRRKRGAKLEKSNLKTIRHLRCALNTAFSLLAFARFDVSSRRHESGLVIDARDQARSAEPGADVDCELADGRAVGPS
jgi:hypothetical protein